MRSRKKLAIFFLFLILTIPLVNKTLQITKQSVWDGESHINIAIDNGDIEIWSIEPSEKSAHRIVIPKNAYLSVGSYGAYRASTIGRLSLLEKKDGSLVAMAIEESLAVPIDAAIVRKEGADDLLELSVLFGPQGLVNTISKAPLSGRVTNLSHLDLFRLWALSLKKESIETIYLTDTNVTSKMSLPDGGEGLAVDRDQFTKLAPKYFRDLRIEEEELTIEILNGTTMSGLANSVAQLITNIGGNVINTAKHEKSDRTAVFAKNDSYTAEKIAKILKGELLRESPKESRADIVVVLGSSGPLGQWPERKDNN